MRNTGSSPSSQSRAIFSPGVSLWPPHLTAVLLFTFQDIFKQATEDRLTSAKELPYFEGDFWPNVLEESIKELEQEEEERKKEESTAASETTEVKPTCPHHLTLLGSPFAPAMCSES